jgi:hypothetical protein
LKPGERLLIGRFYDVEVAPGMVEPLESVSNILDIANSPSKVLPDPNHRDQLCCFIRDSF